jgi:hypothetical protein
MDQAMKDIGKRINNMDSGEKFGQMELHLKASMQMVRNMEKVSLHGQIRAIIQGSS